jgi:hypothetical protein
MRPDLDKKLFIFRETLVYILALNSSSFVVFLLPFLLETRDSLTL